MKIQITIKYYRAHILLENRSIMNIYLWDVSTINLVGLANSYKPAMTWLGNAMRRSSWLPTSCWEYGCP